MRIWNSRLVCELEIYLQQAKLEGGATSTVTLVFVSCVLDKRQGGTILSMFSTVCESEASMALCWRFATLMVSKCLKAAMSSRPIFISLGRLYLA